MDEKTFISLQQHLIFLFIILKVNMLGCGCCDSIRSFFKLFCYIVVYIVKTLFNRKMDDQILMLWRCGTSVQEIAEMLNADEDYVRMVIDDDYKKYVAQFY